MTRLAPHETGYGGREYPAWYDNDGPDDDTMIETCLVCKVAWDVSMDPPRCMEPDHPHALAVFADWNVQCHGLVSEKVQDSGPTDG